MGLTERVEQDLHRALKHRDGVKLRTLRMVKSAMVQAAIAKRPEPLTEADEIKVLRTEVKRRREAIAEYQRGKRQDLVDKETAEVQVLKAYLPAGPDEAALKKIVAETVAELVATGAKDFGQVMGAVMREAGAGADGGVVSKLVHEVLSAEQKKRKA